MCTPAVLLMFHQDRNKGQATAALASSLVSVIGKIICAAPSRGCTSYFDAMSDIEGSNDGQVTPMGEGDSDCHEAFSTFNPLMNLTQIEIEEGKVISG